MGTCERRAQTRDDARAFDRSVNTPSCSHPTRASRERDIARSPRSSSSLDAMKTLCARRIAPGDGFGAKTPPSLSSIQCLGALRRFKCFLSPLAMFLVRRQSFASRKGGGRTTTRRDRRAPAPARARGWGLIGVHTSWLSKSFEYEIHRSNRCVGGVHTTHDSCRVTLR